MQKYLQAGDDTAKDKEVSKEKQNGDDRTGATAYEAFAKALKELKQDDQVISKLEALHEAQPENAALDLFLGQQYVAADKLDKAQPLLEAAHKKQMTEKSYAALAEVYRRSDQPEKLLDLLAQMLEKTGSLTALGVEVKALRRMKRSWRSWLRRLKNSTAWRRKKMGLR